jgi:hypothetical protein
MMSMVSVMVGSPQIAAQTRQTTRKKKTKHAHMKMEIKENATRTNTSK